MPTARKTRHLLVLGVLVGVGAVAFAVRPRGTKLEWYTSPPLTLKGRTVRLQALVPEGWIESRRLRSVADNPSLGSLPLVVIQPSATRARFGWVPAWLMKWPQRERSDFDEVVLVLGNTADAPDCQVSHVPARLIGFEFWASARSIRSDLPCTLSYRSANRAEFESTYRQICESFRVVR